MHSPDCPNQNHLLAALPAPEFERLAAHLELVPFPLGEVIYQPGEKLRHAYFPTSAIVSLQYGMESGASSEVATVGNEGVVGISLFMGDTTPSSAVVQTAGEAFRLEGRLLRQEFSGGGLMQILLLRYTQTLIAQMVQTAACCRHHSVKQRFCRWLLLTIDRHASCQLAMTQELVACTLGVRRESITLAAGELQDAGFIRTWRGHISVLRRDGLESQACECYAVVKNEMARLLADVNGQRRAFAAFSAVSRLQAAGLLVASRPRSVLMRWASPPSPSQAKATAHPVFASKSGGTRQEGILL